MSGERHVVLGLATPRSAWFTEVARWATVGAIAAEFVKCVSTEELRVRLGSGRRFSCLLVDAASGAVDRDLLDAASRDDVPVLVVAPDPEPWLALGAATVLSPALDRIELESALARHSTMVGRAETTVDAAVTPRQDHDPRPVAPLVAVTGAGGAGVSTTAIALAQALADEGADVLLADLQLNADQALLHDARDVIPGVHELVEAHQRRTPSTAEVRAHTFEVLARRYHLLLGLRRPQDWTALRPRSWEAALDGVRRSFDVVVADVGADLDGQAETGSVDVEERNLLARSTHRAADLVLVVGRPDLAALHRVVRTVAALGTHGVATERLLTVLTRAPRGRRARAEIARALDALASTDGTSPPGPLLLARRDDLDAALRDGVRLPAAHGRPLARAVDAMLERAEGRVTARPEPDVVVPGSLGLIGADGAAR